VTQYDFNRVIDRLGTGSYKWDQSEKLFGQADVLPLWVADMDFEAPREVIEAVTERAKWGIYGYTIRTNSYFEAVSGWLSRRHNWDIKKDWIVPTPGIVPALSVLVLTCTEPGDGIILQSPVYYPFYDVIRKNGRTVVDNPLVLENGRYEIDFELLERQASEGAKMLLLCSPHNPGGRVWDRADLERIGEICLRHGVLVVADEIHHDLVFKGHEHTAYGSISESFAQSSITCIAPSKTFNLAGLQAAITVIPNDELRVKFQQQLHTLSLHMESYFGATAVEASYNHGEDWLEQLLVHLEGNLDWLLDYVEKNLPEVKAMRPEGTYLVWMDCTAISEDPAVLKKIMFQDARVAFSDGSVFGKQSSGYLRVNIACPRSLLQEGLERFAQAVKAYQASK